MTVFSAAVFAVLLGSCTMKLDAPLDEFIAEQTKMVSLRTVVSAGDNTPVTTEDGYICVPLTAGNTVSIPLENNHGFSLDIETVLTKTAGAEGHYGGPGGAKRGVPGPAL